MELECPLLRHLMCGGDSETVSKLGNPTHGSGWILQVQPTQEEPTSSESHQRQLVDSSSPTYSANEAQINGNFFAKIIQATKAGLEQSTNCRWWDFKILFGSFLGRLDLNNPPTAVGGISLVFHTGLSAAAELGPPLGLCGRRSRGAH